MRTLEVHPPRAETTSDGLWCLDVRLARNYKEDLLLWYAMPEAQKVHCSWEIMDPFLIAALLKAMEDRAHLRVHGPVSSVLLDNLEEFQRIFSAWFPKAYQMIDILPEAEVKEAQGTDGVLLSFSGGVDSAFSALNHVLGKGPIRRRRFMVKGLLYVEGFDVNIEHEASCHLVVERNRRLFEGFAQLPFLNVRTNLKYLLSIKRFWMAHSCVLASVAHLFKRLCGGCLVGSSHPYTELHPWGSHPLTDRLLSSQAFRMHHDMAFPRMEKLKALRAWPEALDNLKVCWEGQYRYNTPPHRNCGRCDKCIRTMLAFKALGEPIPPSFPDHLTVEKVLSLSDKPFDWSRLSFLREIQETARENGMVHDPLFQALGQVLKEARITSKVMVQAVPEGS